MSIDRIVYAPSINEQGDRQVTLRFRRAWLLRMFGMKPKVRHYTSTRNGGTIWREYPNGYYASTEVTMECLAAVERHRVTGHTAWGEL